MASLKDEFQEKKNKLSEEIKERKEKIEDSIEEKKDQIEESIEKGVKKTKSFFRRLIWGLVILALVALGVFMLYANWTYSDGTRAGDLIKISKKGYIFKTYEGQLKLGGIDLTNKDEGLSDTWSFSVKDNEIFGQLEKLQGQKVVLRYKEINHSMPWQGETECFIYEIVEQEE